MSNDPPHVHNKAGWVCWCELRAERERRDAKLFTADQVIEIANETSDSLGNLYRLDFIDRIRHEAAQAATSEPTS